ncbi:MAG: hypothetical protein O9272_02790 [Brevundimonas sp.]|nr:hypothetical protein [Brevundimonas sp.]
MSRRLPALLAAVAFSLATTPVLGGTVNLTYPETRKLDLVEESFGEKVADPYRWLENDVRTDKEVADWVERQNAVTQRYLGALPQRDWFAQRIRGLMNYERFGLPRKAGGRDVNKRQ